MLNGELSHDLVRPSRGMRRPMGTQGNGHPMMARLKGDNVLIHWDSLVAVERVHSSSLSSSIATSPSLSSSSSSRVRFWPRFSSASSLFEAWVAAGTVGFSKADPGGGALKILCWSSVCSTTVAPVVVGILNVPSSFATKCDLDLAYWIF